MRYLNNKRVFSFLSDSKTLFWYYVLVNMIPSMFLVFTEPYNFAGKLVLIFFPLSLYIFFLSLSKNTGLLQILLFPLAILHSFQIVLMYLFGEAVIAVDMFLNVVTTNAEEAGELLNSLWGGIILVCLLYIPSTIIAIWQWRKKIFLDFNIRKKYILVAVLSIVLSFILSLFAANINTADYAFYRDAYPSNIFYNLGFAVKKWKRVNKYEETSKDYTFEAVKNTSSIDNREIYVLVIGETSRAENWSLFGYERETTPNLQKEANLIYYPDAITQSNTTHKSVSIMLSEASAENYDIIYSQKSILEAFKEVGFTTIFLSNQGINHSFTEFFANQADISRNIRSVGDLGLTSVNNYDEALIPIFEHYVDSIQGNLFIVLHSYGSHFNYSERYPQEFSRYKPDNITGISKKDRDRLLNAYDNTILYTDHFLSSLINVIKKENTCSTLVFSSDHGEDLLDDDRMRFLHASPNPTFYQLRVPLFVWFSEYYTQNYPDKFKAASDNVEKPISTNVIFHTLLDIANIQAKGLDKGRSLVDPQLKISKRMYLNDHDEPVFYYNANLKEEDKEMIEKRNMQH